MYEVRVGNNQNLSVFNRRAVLHAVRLLQPTYRAEVARKTQLKRPTITKIVGELQEKGYLREFVGNDELESNGGRPPQLLEINGDIGHILAIDLEPDRIRVAVTNALLGILVYRDRLIDRFSDSSVVLKQIIELCSEALQKQRNTRIQGIGISLPGLIDREKGILLSSTNMPKWKNVYIRDILSERLGLPVKVDRSSYLAALYENWLHPPLKKKNCTLVVTLRTGVGLSMIRDGIIQLGETGYDGEIGHTLIDINGQKCECGSSGCLETFISASAICKQVEKYMSQGRCDLVRRTIDQGEVLTPELVYHLASQGDPDSIEIVDYVGKYLGIAISNMVNLFGADEVIVSGSVDMTDGLILDSIKRTLHSNTLRHLRDNTIVVRLSNAKERAPLLGAAVLVARDIFENVIR